MAKPWIHAKSSVNKQRGGSPEDYLPIHQFMDSSKAHVPDHRHRALFHSSFGIFVAEQVFNTIQYQGELLPESEIVRLPFIVNSDGKQVHVRDIGEQHVVEDLGTIPTVWEYLEHMTPAIWMGGKPKSVKVIKPGEESKENDNE